MTNVTGLRRARFNVACKIAPLLACIWADLPRGEHCERSIDEEIWRRLRCYRCHRFDDFEALRLPGCKAQDQLVRWLMADGISRRVCIDTFPVTSPTSSDKPVQLHRSVLRFWLTARSASQILVNRKNWHSSMICITICIFFCFYFASQRTQKCKAIALLLRKIRWIPHAGAETATI